MNRKISTFLISFLVTILLATASTSYAGGGRALDEFNRSFNAAARQADEAARLLKQQADETARIQREADQALEMQRAQERAAQEQKIFQQQQEEQARFVREQQAQMERQVAEQQRIERELAEKQRIEAERIETERIAREKYETEQRLIKERQEEQARLAKIEEDNKRWIEAKRQEQIAQQNKKLEDERFFEQQRLEKQRQDEIRLQEKNTLQAQANLNNNLSVATNSNTVVAQSADKIKAGVDKLPPGQIKNETLAAAAKAEKDAASLTQNNVSVYQSIGSDGSVQYIGITNNIGRRAAQHMNQKGIVIEELPGLTDLSRADAKSVEQVLIEKYGLNKNGGSLSNKINSISPNNDIYEESIARGKELLKEAGY